MTDSRGTAWSGSEQRRSLREQAVARATDRVAPGVSSAAVHAADPLRQVLGYLPVLVEHGGPIIQALRRTVASAEGMVPPRKQIAVVRLARHAAIAVAVLGARYLVYRLASLRKPAAGLSPERSFVP